MSFKSGFVSAVLVLTAFSVSVAPAWAQAGSPPAERRVLGGGFVPPAAGPIKIAFIDADSTLRVAPSGKPSANGPEDVAILPLVAPALKKLASDGYLIAVMSNQAGIAHGYITLDTANSAFAFTGRQLARLGATLHYVDFADKEDEDRKPGIGMGRRLAALVQSTYGRPIDWAHTIMIGDSGWKKSVDVEPDGTPGEDFDNNDRLFAENLAHAFGGVMYYHPRDYFHWVRYGARNFSNYQALKDFVGQHPDLDPGVNAPAH